MKCMNCGAELTDSAYCPNCGCDVSVQKQAIVLSGLYYNQGLEKAQVRDLSGATDQLKRSLKFNKLNIDARNLLGLVYFETGEVVAALSEWVISKNIQPENNIAADYIRNLQQDSNRLDVINQTIKKYNFALQSCLDGNEDVAAIQLKKVLAQNPKLIKGYHLLSLLYIHQGEYEKARRLLKKAIRIDKTNTTTLRFLHEVDEQTGTTTTFEPHWTLLGGRRASGDTASETEEQRKRAQAAAYRQGAHHLSVMNLIAGLLIGAAAVWFIFIPARTRAINQEANKKVTEYSSSAADYSAQIASLTAQTTAAQSEAAAANSTATDANNKVGAITTLLAALNYYENGDTATAKTIIAQVDASLLGADAKGVYTDLADRLSYDTTGSKSSDTTSSEGTTADTTKTTEADTTANTEKTATAATGD
jgi:Tfp pilus assembly protein PilF